MVFSLCIVFLLVFFRKELVMGFVIFGAGIFLPVHAGWTAADRGGPCPPAPAAADHLASQTVLYLIFASFRLVNICIGPLDRRALQFMAAAAHGTNQGPTPLSAANQLPACWQSSYSYSYS